MGILVIDGLHVELTRKNIKRVNMRIKEDGRILISAPYLTPQFEIENFVRSKRDWIDKNIVKVQQRAAARPEPASTAEKERLRRALRARIAGRMPAIEQRTGFRANGFAIRDMHTRWGSCNTTTNHLNFSLMLAYRSDEELDYIILHELAHTNVPNHGPEFKAILDRYCPNWRAIQKQLKNT